MPLYYVLYCGVGVNYRRLMLGKKYLGESEAKARTTREFLNHGWLRQPILQQETPNISAEYLRPKNFFALLPL